MLKRKIFFTSIILLIFIHFVSTVYSETNSYPIINNVYWDFNEGIGQEFVLDNPTQLFSLDNSSGNIRLYKPVDNIQNTIKSAKIGPDFDINGDFDLRVDYNLINPLENGNQVELQIYGDSFIFFVVRSNEPGLGGQNVHVYFGESPDGIQPNPGIQTNANSGTLRVVKNGEQISAYYKTEETNGFQLIYERQENKDDRVRFRLALQNQPDSYNALNVSFDNLRIKTPVIYLFANESKWFKITDGISPYTVSLSNTEMATFAVSGDTIMLKGNKKGNGILSVYDQSGNNSQIEVNVIMPGQILGQLVDNEGFPLPYMQVEYSSYNSGQQTSSDENGLFRLETVPPGYFELRIFPDPKSNLVPFSKIFFIDEAQTLNLGKIELLRGIIITGILHDSQENPVPHIQLNILESHHISAETDDNGQFTFCLNEGEWTLKLDEENNDNFGLIPFKFSVNNEKPIQNIGVLKTYDYTEENKISGIITNNTNSNVNLQVAAFLSEFPITQENIMNIEPVVNGYPDNNGNYKIHVPQGIDIQLYLVSLDYTQQPHMSVTVLQSKETLQSPASNVNFTLDNAGYEIIGQVVHQGYPKQGVRAILYRQLNKEFMGFSDTNMDGQFIFGHVPDGQYLINIVGEDSFGESSVFTVNENLNLTPIEISFMGDNYLYDDFNSYMIDPLRWHHLEKVRTIKDGALLSVIRSFDKLEINSTKFSQPENIHTISCDINVLSVDVMDDGLASAGTFGHFYSSQIDGIDSDIIAGAAIMINKNNAEFKWFVEKLINIDNYQTEILGTGNLIAENLEFQMNNFYRLKVSYDGNNGFTFQLLDKDSGSIIASENYNGPNRTGNSLYQVKEISTWAEKNAMINALFDNVQINNNNNIYDSFDNHPLDPSLWSSRETLRYIKDGKLISGIHGVNENNSNSIIIPVSKPYIEAKVGVSNLSQIIEGAKGRVQVGGYFYNDSYGPDSGYDYNGYMGNVWAQIYIDQYQDGTLRAKCYVERVADSDNNNTNQIFAHQFSLPIESNKLYSLSIRNIGTGLVFRIIDIETTYEEVQVFSIKSPCYQPFNGMLSLETKIYSEIGEGGYILASFDDIHVSDTLPPSGKITGKVADTNGKPLANISGTVFSEPCWNKWVCEFITDESGNYTIPIIEGDYFIIITPPSDGTNPYIQKWFNYEQGTYNCGEASPVHIKANQTITDINFVLEQGVRVYGSIKENDGSPIRNACVGAMSGKCNGENVGGSSTDENGNFNFVIPEGEYYFATNGLCDFNESPYLTMWWNNVINCEDANIVIVSNEQSPLNLDFSLIRGGVIKGIVIDENGFPVINAHIESWNEHYKQWRDVYSDHEGRFVLNGIADGEINISIRPDISMHFIENHMQIYLGERDYKDLGNIILRRGAIVTGVLQDSEGNPLPEKYLSLGGKFRLDDIKTNEQGSFYVCVPNGDWILYLDDYNDDDDDASNNNNKYNLYPVMIHVDNQEQFINLGILNTYSRTTENLISGTVSITNNIIGTPEVVLLMGEMIITPESINYVESYDETKIIDGKFELYSPAGKKANLFLIISSEDDNENSETLTIVDRLSGITAPSSNLILSHNVNAYTIEGDIRLLNASEFDNYGIGDIILFRASDNLFAGFAEANEQGKYFFYNVVSDTYKIAVNNYRTGQIIWTDEFTVSDNIVLDPIEIEIRPSVKGDINNNGKLDLIDVIILMKKCANTE